MNEVLIALRRLARRPRFTLPAVATLAVGVGCTTAIFSAVNAALLRPLPYAQPEDVYVLGTARVDGGWSNGRVSNAEMTAIVAAAPSVVAVAGAGGASRDVIVADDGRNRQVNFQAVTPSFFELTGVPMAIGGASLIDAEGGSYGAVVLSYQVWEEVFAADPEILGGALRLASGSATIVGVTPKGFNLPEDTDVWLVDTFAPASTGGLEGFLRVRPGTRPEVLHSELAAVMNNRVQDGLDPGGRAFVVTPLVTSIVGDLGPILWIVLAAAVVLLVLGCANVASLMLARGRSQKREIAIRKILGASRGSVVRQLLMESLVLSTLGTGFGLLLAYAGVHGLSALGADGLPRLDDVTFDPTVLIAAVGALVTTAVLVGLLPMVRLPRVGAGNLMSDGRSTGGERGSRRLLSGIVVAEIAMAIVLLAGAGWLVRSYANLADVDPGFVPQSRLVFRTALLGSSYVPIDSIGHSDGGAYMIPDRTAGGTVGWFRDLSLELRQSDQVRAVGLGSIVPFRSEPQGVQYVSIPGRAYDPNAPDIVRVRYVSPGFFQAMGMRVLAGRTLAADDPASAVVVNEAFVRAYLPEDNPLGLSFSVGFRSGEFSSERTIAGVVGDVRYRSLREPDVPAIYGLGYDSRGYVVVATTLSDPAPLVPSVRAAVGAVDPGVPVEIQPLEQVMSTELARHRLGLLLMSLFAAASLVLAGIGIHGVVQHDTSLRAREFAVRIAIGAGPGTIARSILGGGGVLGALGVSIGAGLAYGAGRIGSGRLYEVRASDPVILVAAVAAVSVLALGSMSVSAIRGSQVQPGDVLRAD